VKQAFLLALALHLPLGLLVYHLSDPSSRGREDATSPPLNLIISQPLPPSQERGSESARPEERESVHEIEKAVGERGPEAQKKAKEPLEGQIGAFKSEESAQLRSQEAGGQGQELPPLLNPHLRPQYPPGARRRRLEGRVLYKIRINAQGRIDDLELLEASHSLFVDSAREYLEALRFQAPEGEFAGSFEVIYKLR